MRQSLSSVKPYLTPKTEGLGLQSNTNRLGPNPVYQRLGALLDGLSLNNYPDNTATELRQALGDLHGLNPESFLITNGSNEAFDIIFKTFLNPDETAAFPSPSYSMYPYYAKANAVNAFEVPLDDVFDLDVDGFLSSNAELLIVCTPNNPTGNTLRADRIKALLDSGRRIVVDEAYGEFAQDNWIAQIDNYPNLIVTRTLSKAYGLAGLRLGYLAAQPDTIDLIMRARLPYNVNSLSQAVAVAALQETQFLEKYLSLIQEQRPLWASQFEQRGFRVYPSQSNFILTQVPDGINRDNLVENLINAGVIVRSSGQHPRLLNCVRVTIGTAEDSVNLFSALDEVLA